MLPSRLALVIGNGNYCTEGNLRSIPSSLKDAQNMAATLSQLDFKIHPRKKNTDELPLDLGQHEMQALITDFIIELDSHPNAVVFIYFSGHGCHDKANQSFLLPTDYTDQELSSTRLWCANTMIRSVTRKLKTGYCVAVFDACRNVGTKSSEAQVSQYPYGTAPVRIQGSIVAYSCESGRLSYTGLTSRYTDCLLKHLMLREDLGYIFRRVNCELSVHPDNTNYEVQQSHYIDSLRSMSRVYLHEPRYPYQLYQTRVDSSEPQIHQLDHRILEACGQMIFFCVLILSHRWMNDKKTDQMMTIHICLNFLFLAVLEIQFFTGTRQQTLIDALLMTCCNYWASRP